MTYGRFAINLCCCEINLSRTCSLKSAWIRQELLGTALTVIEDTGSAKQKAKDAAIKLLDCPTLARR